jgi:hypothetical protein
LKLQVDATQLPEKFVATEALEYLNNQDFMRKSGENIKAELTATLEKAKKQATQKVDKSKKALKQKKIQERLAEQ